MSRTDFRLPDLGEGLTEAEVLQWLVAVGDEVAVNQPLVEVETAKAAVEIPSPVAGVVAELRADVGQVLPVGEVLLSIESAAKPEPTEPTRRESAPTESAPAPRAAHPRENILVGYGPQAETTRRRRRQPAPAAEPPRSHPAPLRVAAKPPVRKLARDLGIDLRTIPTTDPDGVVTRADVERAQAQRLLPAPARTPGRDEERHIPVRGVRRATAEAMTSSASVPTASVRLAVDMTETMRLRDRLTTTAELQDVHLTVLHLVARALLLALRRQPLLHARWDEQAQEIVIPNQVDLGVAVAGPRGLLVPKVRAADTLTLIDLAAAVGRAVEVARAGSATPEELRNGTITITNVGVFDVDGGTPLLTPGETAILCLGAVRERAWVVGGSLTVRQVAELTLAFDHRVVDGEQAARFLADLGSLLREPALMLARS